MVIYILNIGDTLNFFNPAFFCSNLSSFKGFVWVDCKKTS